MKKIMVLVVIIIIVVALIVINLVAFKSDQYKILTKKFYIPITEDYEILFFENVEGDYSVRHCYAELKVTEEQFDVIISQMGKARYSSRSLDDYTVFLQKNEWMNHGKISLVYEKCKVEWLFPIYSYRSHMDIFITDLEGGYRYIYLRK